MLLIRRGPILHPEEIEEEKENTIPVAFEITNTNGKVDYIHRRYIMEYLRNYPMYYGNLVTTPNKEYYDTNVKIAKIRVVITDDISKYDWRFCTFSIKDVAKEVALHRKTLTDIRKLAGIIKWFSKNCVFDLNKELDVEMM